MNIASTLRYPVQEWLRRSPLRSLTAAACVCTAVYWLGIASDRYVSESRLIIQSTNLEGTLVYSKGKLVAHGGVDTYYIFISAKHAD